MTKHFIIDPSSTPLSKESITRIQQDKETVLANKGSKEDQAASQKLAQEDFLVHTQDRVVVKVDMEFKNSHAFEDGTVIRRERLYNEFNRRIAQPVNCIVISGEGIPKGAELLVSHNAFHETNRINDYKNSFEKEDSDRVRYFSIPTYECFVWRLGEGDWTPLYPFEFGLRVFKPYKGKLEGIEPEQLKDVLYVTSDCELKGKVVKTLKGCDYIVVYQNSDNREGQLLIFRPFGDIKRRLDEEAIAILHEETKQVEDGNLLVGYEIKDAKCIVQLK